MTKAEFKEKATAIFAAGPSEEARAALPSLIREGRQTIPLAELAMAAAEALDDAYPGAAFFYGPENTAAARMARHLNSIH